jgi:hypothetical protein
MSYENGGNKPIKPVIVLRGLKKEKGKKAVCKISSSCKVTTQKWGIQKCIS